MAPPKKFQDPDVDLHKSLDLRGTDSADMSAQDLNSAVNDQDGDGFDDETGEPVDPEQGADDMQPTLTCPACGFGAPAAEPMSINTEDPDGGSDPEGGPAEGDVCPNCGGGLMQSSESLGEGEEGMGPDGPTPEDEDVPVDPETGQPMDPDEVEDEMDDNSSPFPSKDDDEPIDEEEEPDPDDEEEDDDDSPFPKKPARR